MTTDAPALIALWSAPRCRSTAFLRMMVERGDRVVVHEPFSQLTDFGHTEVDGRRVEDEDTLMDVLLALSARRATFFKDTTDFRYPRLLERTDFLGAVRHAMIIRHPAEAVASHHELNPDLTRDEVGFERLAELHDRLVGLGAPPVVLDSDDLLTDPDATVRAVCAALGIDHRPEALQWEAGLRPEWERTGRWHRATSATTGFTARDTGAADAATASVSADPRLAGFVEHHLGFYEHLRERRIRA